MKKLLILLLTASTLFGQFKFQRSLPDRYTMLFIDFSKNSIVEKSQYGGYTITNNSVTLSSSYSLFGWTSGYFSGSAYLSVSQQPYIDLGSESFTIDAWIYPTSVSSYHNIVQYGQAGDGGNYSIIVFRINPGGYMQFLCSSNGSTQITNFTTSSSVISINNWQHVAVTRNVSSFYLFVNGVQRASGTGSGSLWQQTNRVLLLGQNKIGEDRLIGYMSNFRITKGIALWTGGTNGTKYFNPPNKPY